MKNTKKGFTLIELLVVIAIIGVLAAVIIASINSARARGRDAQRVSDIRQLSTALELYYNSNGFVYPAKGPAFTANPSVLVTQGFIPKIPTDPSTGSNYLYFGLGSGAGACTGYHLGATMESGNAVLNTDADAAASTGCAGNGGSAVDFAGTDPVYDIKK